MIKQYWKKIDPTASKVAGQSPQINSTNNDHQEVSLLCKKLVRFAATILVIAGTCSAVAAMVVPSVASADSIGQCNNYPGNYISSTAKWRTVLANEGVSSQAASQIFAWAGYVALDQTVAQWENSRVLIGSAAESFTTKDFGCRSGVMFSAGTRSYPAGKQVFFVLPKKYSKADIRLAKTKVFSKGILVRAKEIGAPSCGNTNQGWVYIRVYVRPPHPKKKPVPAKQCKKGYKMSHGKCVKPAKKQKSKPSPCKGVTISGSYVSGGQCFVLECGKSTVVTPGNQDSVGSSVCSPATGGTGGSTSGSGSGSGSGTTGSSGGSGGATGGSGSGGTGGTGGSSSGCSSAGGGGGSGGGAGSGGSGGTGGAGGSGGDVNCYCVTNAPNSTVTCTTTTPTPTCTAPQLENSSGTGCYTPPTAVLNMVQEVDINSQNAVKATADNVPPGDPVQYCFKADEGSVSPSCVTSTTGSAISTYTSGSDTGIDTVSVTITDLSTGYTNATQDSTANQSTPDYNKDWENVTVQNGDPSTGRPS